MPVCRLKAGRFGSISLLSAGLLLWAGAALAENKIQPTPKSPDLVIADQAVRHIDSLQLLVFEQRVKGQAGATVPEPNGEFDGAPALAYVFPTTLSPTAVGFGDVAGTLALAATSHPDFDDTPLWDEDLDGSYDNAGDGRVWHSHWVVLGKDERVAGGLSTVQFNDGDAVTLPPTNPGMAIYLDSPGFAVVTDGDWIRIIVPQYRVSGQTDFRFDAVTAYLEVNTSDPERPTLGVYEVYDVASDDLSLPYRVSSTAAE